MKKIAAALGVALAASLAANGYLLAPDPKPGEPVYVQRVEQLLDATNAGQWKRACDAAPTAAYSYSDFAAYAIMFGVTNYKEAAVLCEKLLSSAATKLDGKTPVGLSYEIVWYTPDRPDEHPPDRMVIVNLKWNGEEMRTVVFHVQAARVPWEGGKAKCGAKKEPCPAMRWYVVGAD